MKRVNAVATGPQVGLRPKNSPLPALVCLVLFERGKWYTAADCRKDDLRNQRTTILGNAFGTEDESNPRVQVDAHGTPHIALPSEGAYQNNPACVGGGTLSYSAQAWRYLPLLAHRLRRFRAILRKS